MGRGAWWAIVRGVAQSQTRLSDWAQHTQQGKWEEKLNGGTSDRCAVIKRRLTRSSRVCKPGLQRHPVASRNGPALTSGSWQETSTEKCSLLANLAMSEQSRWSPWSIILPAVGDVWSSFSQLPHGRAPDHQTTCWLDTCEEREGRW